MQCPRVRALPLRDARLLGDESSSCRLGGPGPDPEEAPSRHLEHRPPSRAPARGRRWPAAPIRWRRAFDLISQSTSLADRSRRSAVRCDRSARRRHRWRATSVGRRMVPRTVSG